MLVNSWALFILIMYIGDHMAADVDGVGVLKLYKITLYFLIP